MFIALAFAIDVLTVGGTIADHVLFTSEEYLKTVPGKKGGSELVDYPLFCQIVENCDKPAQVTFGGSGVNVIKGLARLGHSTALISKLGNDEKGVNYSEHLRELGVIERLTWVNLPTGRSACLVTPDGERTMRTFLGASMDLSDLALNPQDFKNVKLFHIEGYQLVDENFTRKVVEFAKNEGAIISLDCACFEIVKAHKNFLLELLKESVDIVFANEEEAKGLTDLPAQEACSLLASLCGTAVVTMGEKGCFVQKGEQKHFQKALKAQVIDTTGAGDLFAAGFLHGYLNEMPLDACALYGTLVASQIVEVIGAELPEARWSYLRTIIR